MPTVYNFEAKSIQNYILDSSKLKDMIGASEQIEYLCHDDVLSNEEQLLDNVLKSLGLDESKVNFSRKAGGAFQALFSNEDDAKNFQAVWIFCVQQAFPGITFAQGMATDDRLKTALEFARSDLFKHDHNAFFPQLPLAGPLIARSPRTGQPAVARLQLLDQRSERLDTTTVQKRAFRDATALIKKLHFDTGERLIHWPVNLDKKDQEEGTDEKTFPLLPNNRYIAIIHADGNNLGQLLKTIQEKLLANDITVARYAEVLRAYSQAIEKTTVESAKRAIETFESTKQTIIDFVDKGVVQQSKKIMPARPLVLAGDDFTFIVRGDLALNFTQVFLEQFEKQSETQLNELKKKYSELDCLPEKLTAGAGIAYIKASQPFYQGYKLAESLCKSAKNFAKSHVKKEELVPACLAFHRITTSIIDNYDTALKHELRRKIGNHKGIQFTMQPYFVGEVKPSQRPNECIQINAFKSLLRFFQSAPISQGTFREFLTLLESEQELADSAMQRWHDNMSKAGKTKLLNTLKEILAECQLGNQPIEALKLVGSEIKVDETPYVRTPIGDALALMSISKGGDDVSDSI